MYKVQAEISRVGTGPAPGKVGDRYVGSGRWRRPEYDTISRKTPHREPNWRWAKQAADELVGST
jgi:hypothetical protein